MIAFFDLREEEKFILKEEFGDQHFYSKNSVSKEVVKNLEDVEILCVFVDSVVDEEIIDLMPELKHITTRSTGVDHIDMEYAHQQDITVSNVPSYGTETVAEFTFALMLSVSRKITQAYDYMRKDKDFSLKKLRGFDLNNKTLGVLGTGEIGSHVIKIAKGFGMDVLAYDLYPKEDFAEELGFEYVEDIEKILSGSDIISLHLPLTDQTRYIIRKDTIEKMKNGVCLINTARGELVKTSDLIEALEDGKISAAGLDVCEEEDEIKKITEGNIQSEEGDEDFSRLKNLIERDDVIITPHIGFYSKEAEEEILQKTIQNIKSFLEKGQSLNKVKGNF